MDANTQLFLAAYLEEEDEDDCLSLLLQDEDCELFQKRREEGTFQILVLKHLVDNETKFKEFFRLTPLIFNEVLNCIKEDLICGPSKRYPNPISPEEKLGLTLRYLATGESFRSLAFSWRICHSWISTIIATVVSAIRKHFGEKYMPSPTKEHFKKNAQRFYKRWNYPNCCAAIDGKHIRIVCPPNTGSLNFNYKDYFSTVLLAIVDPNYKFVAVDVGAYGGEGDASIYERSNFGRKINKGEFNIPPPNYLPGTTMLQPYVILGDSAFGLTENMMKPYPQNLSAVDGTVATYNYRHSRGRRTTENTFGIMCQYFRIFFTPIAVKRLEVVDDIIYAACLLHNMLRENNVTYPGECKHSTPTLPTENLIPIAPSNNRHSTFAANSVRDSFKQYFNSSAGSVEWQYRHVNRTT